MHPSDITCEQLKDTLKQFVGETDADLRFFGEFFLFFNFEENNKIPTAGVTIDKNAQLKFLYNSKFIESLDKEEMPFLMMHEMFHILWSHVQRTGTKERQMSNIVQDMIINDHIKGEYDINEWYKELTTIEPLYIPEEYKGEKIFEILYAWMKREEDKYKDWKDEQDEGKGEEPDDKEGENGDGKGGEDGEPSNDGKGTPGCPVSPQLEKLFDSTSKEEYTFDVHFEDMDISEEMKNEIINDIVNNIKNRGYMTSSVETFLNKIKKSSKDYLKEIKKCLGAFKGTQKQASYSKRNRRGLPTKGNKKINASINVILDTSGSMDSMFEKVLSYIFQDDILINLIQIDTEIKVVEKVKSKSQLQKLKIQGLGGTTLQPAVDKIAEAYNKLPTVILTDGYTDTLNFNSVKNKVLILTTDVDCPIVSGKTNKVKQIKIK